MIGRMRREYTPSGAQIPLLIQVVPPATPSTTAATPAPNSPLEMIPPRHSPNDPDIISIARGNALITTPAQTRSFNPDVSAAFPSPTIEYASAAQTEMSTRKTAPTAALDAVAADPQPACPASRNTPRIAAANHIRLRTPPRPKKTTAHRIRVW